MHLINSIVSSYFIRELRVVQRQLEPLVTQGPQKGIGTGGSGSIDSLFFDWEIAGKQSNCNQEVASNKGVEIQTLIRSDMDSRGRYHKAQRAYEEDHSEPIYQLQDPGYSQNYQQHQSLYMGGGSPPMRHWKTYLAPELARQDRGDTSQDVSNYRSVNPNERPRNLHNIHLQGARSHGHLQQLNRGGGEDQGSGSVKNINSEYSRRKEEILNRIKALQNKTSKREEGEPKNNNPSIVKREEKRGSKVEERLLSLEERVAELESSFQSRMETLIKQLQSRFSA